MEVDGRRMLTQRIVVSQIVSRCQRPFSIATDKAEIAGMVVEIVGAHVESHASELLLYGFYGLRQVAC